ncbi:MAG: PH domain-containing protein [Sphingomicrobium sp.]
MNEAAIPGADQLLGPPERMHPLYLLTGIGKSLKGAWGLLAAAAVLGSQDRWLLVALLGILFVVVSIGGLLLKWLKFEYRVGADEIRIESGLLNRTSRAIPFDRVTDVDLEQGPLHRLFGLARVRLETGASAGSNEEDGVLDTISLERAEALREHIRARRRGEQVAPVTDAIAEGEPLYAMDGRRVATAGLFNFSLAVIAGLFGVTQTFGDVLGFDPFEEKFWLDLLDRAEPVRALLLAHQIVAILAGTVLLILLGIGTGLVRTTLREHGFRLDRTETGLRRRRGLLTLTDVTIPAKRVQAAILANGPIRQRFGWWVLKLQSLAMDGKKGDHVVAPLAHVEEAASILNVLQWPIAPQAEAWRRVSRAFFGSYAAAVGPPMIFPLAVPFLGSAGLSVVAALPFLGIAAVLWLVLAPMMIAARWFDWRNTRYALDRDTLFVETGWWRHRRRILPLRKIQSVDLAESFWSRAFGICTLRLGVAGGGGFSDHHVPALSRHEAESLRARLLAR